MLDTQTGQDAVPVTNSPIEFLRAQLSPLSDGGYFVSLTATTVDQEEPELLDRELLCNNVPSIDDALALLATHARHAFSPN